MCFSPKNVSVRVSLFFFNSKNSFPAILSQPGRIWTPELNQNGPSVLPFLFCKSELHLIGEIANFTFGKFTVFQSKFAEHFIRIFYYKTRILLVFFNVFITCKCIFGGEFAAWLCSRVHSEVGGIQVLAGLASSNQTYCEPLIGKVGLKNLSSFGELTLVIKIWTSQ